MCELLANNLIVLNRDTSNLGRYDQKDIHNGLDHSKFVKIFRTFLLKFDSSHSFLSPFVCLFWEPMVECFSE